MSASPPSALPPIAWGADGLVPVIIVDDRSGAVLTLAYANEEAVTRTLASHSTWLYSRSRGELWHKGATSGNTQHVVAVAADCDADALIYRVVPGGPACHTGRASCFAAPLRLDGTPAAPGFAAAVENLAGTIAQRKRNPTPDSYTAALFAGGVDRIGKKIGEEAVEVVIAAKNADRNELIWETADLLYHTLVLLAEREIALDEVGAELTRRAIPKT
jgi:phosphoribosyl-ATP pyrophosphohydrolase/phosphoribosyl-AMP cyclohydrolase